MADAPAPEADESLAEDAQSLIVDAGQVVLPAPADGTPPPTDGVDAVLDPEESNVPAQPAALEIQTAAPNSETQRPTEPANAAVADPESESVSLAGTPAVQDPAGRSRQPKSDVAPAPSRSDSPIAPATTAVNAGGGSDASSQQNNDAGAQQQPSSNQSGLVGTTAEATPASKSDPAAPLVFQVTTPQVSSSGSAVQPQPAAAQAAPSGADQRFADDNVDRIVSGVKTELLPRGGSMQLRLDPPQLGKLDVTVKLQDGVLTAAFVTRNDEAARLLSQTLSQLKSSLEASGVQVDRLHVQQAAPSERSSDPRNHDQGGRQQQQSAGEQQQWQQSEQQRRELLQRMWKRLGLAGDPLDVMA